MRPPIVRFRGAAGGFLRVFRREGARWPYHAERLHGHRFFVLNYLTRGSGTMHTPRGSIRLAAGHAFLVAPGELHETSGVAHMGGWVVEFTEDAVPDWLARPGRTLHARVPARERAEWERALARLENETAGAALGAREAQRAILMLLLVDLTRLVSPSAAPSSALVREVLGAIDRRFAEPGLSLAALARAVGRSPSHVTSVVRAETGMTVLEKLTDRRMAEARRRLAETDEDVAIVGERVGLLDPAYFARRFRAAHGLSPRAYRKACR